MNNSTPRLPALLDAVDKRIPTFKTLLPPSIPVQRFVAAVKTALMTVPDLATCTAQSITLACMRCASDGLVPDGRDAVLVVGRSKVDGEWRNVAQYWVMVGGLQKIVYRAGRVVRLEARIVREADDFEVQYGTEPGILHRPARRDRGEVIGVYAVATMKGGEVYVEYMDDDEVQGIMRRSKSFDREKGEPKGPWKSDYAEMARKTVIRRACKYLPTESAGHDEDREAAEPETELASGALEFQTTHRIEGGQTSSGGLVDTGDVVIDAEDAQAVAEAEQVVDAPEPSKPSQATPALPSRREINWKAELRKLRDAIAAVGSKEAVEDAWTAWDNSLDGAMIPVDAAAKVKELVDARLAAIDYNDAKGGTPS